MGFTKKNKDKILLLNDLYKSKIITKYSFFVYEF